jgi:hypothetical protein
VIGQQAGALLVGDAKQRSALYAFLRSPILAASSAATFESLRILLEGGAVLLDSSASARCRCGAAVSKSARDADVGSRTQQLQALLARVQNTAVHIEDLSLGKLEHAATPCSALGVDGAVRARVRFPSQQRCVESDACRAELASRSCQQLLAVRAMLASVGDGRADESSDLLLAVCPTLLAMALREDFRLQTCARLLIAATLQLH